MKIRWRQHELLLFAVILVFYILGILSKNERMMPVGIRDFFVEQLSEQHIHTVTYRDQTGALKTEPLAISYSDSHSNSTIAISIGIILFLALVYLNEVIIARMINRQKRVRALINIVILLGVVAVSLATAKYSLDVSLNIPYLRLRRLLFESSMSGLYVAVKLFFFYGIYATLREWAIRSITKQDGQREYRVMICNRITAVIAIYLSVLTYSGFFLLFDNRVYFLFFCFFLPPAIISFFIMLYWFFPFKGNTPFFNQRIWPRYLGVILLIAAVFGLLFVGTTASDQRFSLYFFICCAMQILISTGVASLVYNQQKEKLDALRGLETALGKSDANLKFLRSQINPHFLFNALNTIYGTALQEKAERTAEAVQQLGDMMRFMLHENERDTIALSKELEYLDNYISLQKLRTKVSDKINIQTDIMATNGNFSIAPMLLIPFIENAFKHGISLEKPSFIKTVLRQKENILYFDVHNSIHHTIGKDTEQFKSGIGLENVRQRLNLIYPGRHELIVHESGSEFFIHLKIVLT